MASSHPASSAFSTSSLTTDAGRSTTSPAAIWFARTAGEGPDRRLCRWIAHCAESPRVPAPGESAGTGSPGSHASNSDTDSMWLVCGNMSTSPVRVEAVARDRARVRARIARQRVRIARDVHDARRTRQPDVLDDGLGPGPRRIDEQPVPAAAQPLAARSRVVGEVRAVERGPQPVGGRIGSCARPTISSSELQPGHVRSPGRERQAEVAEPAIGIEHLLSRRRARASTPPAARAHGSPRH